MKSMEISDQGGHTPIFALADKAADDDVSYQETSHVFKCMQCDLQFQTDIAVVRQDQSLAPEEGLMRIRLDSDTVLQQDTASALSGFIEQAFDEAMHEGKE